MKKNTRAKEDPERIQLTPVWKRVKWSPAIYAEKSFKAVVNCIITTPLPTTRKSWGLLSTGKTSSASSVDFRGTKLMCWLFTSAQFMTKWRIFSRQSSTSRGPGPDLGNIPQRLIQTVQLSWTRPDMNKLWRKAGTQEQVLKWRRRFQAQWIQIVNKKKIRRSLPTISI